MAANDTLCITWDDHSSTLLESIQKSFIHGTTVDCTLAAEGRFLDAHKLVLSACSPYFDSLLAHPSNTRPILILKDVRYDEMVELLNFMYVGKVSIREDHLQGFLAAAVSLQIKGLCEIARAQQLAPAVMADSEGEEDSLSGEEESLSGEAPVKNGATPKRKRVLSESASDAASDSPGSPCRKLAKRAVSDSDENMNRIASGDNDMSQPQVAGLDADDTAD